MAKNLLIITVITVALVALGVTATYITLRQGGKEVRRRGEVATIPEEPLVQPEAPTTNDPIDTSDWTVYENGNYGFSLRYPKEWSIFPRFNEPRFSSVFSFYDPSVAIPGAEWEEGWIRVMVLEGKEAIAGELKWLDREESSARARIEEFHLGEHIVAKKITDPRNPEGNFGIDIFSYDKNLLVSLGGPDKPWSEEFKEILSLVVSSFRLK